MSPIKMFSNYCFQTIYFRFNEKPENQKGRKSNMKISAITILGRDVTIPDEVIIRNSIVLPGKELTWGLNNQILL